VVASNEWRLPGESKAGDCVKGVNERARLRPKAGVLDVDVGGEAGEAGDG